MVGSYSIVLVIRFSIALPIIQALVNQGEFQHILRVLNTHIDGKQKIVYALTSIKGIGRRFATAVCKKAEVDIRKRYLVILYEMIVQCWRTEQR